MYEITKATLVAALKPFDIVTDKDGSVGFIAEVSVNSCQPEAQHQISYSVRWLVGTQTKIAWWYPGDLEYHCNLFVSIAEATCHAFSSGAASVQTLFNHMERER